ncbi:MAG: D-2-hydroxyacid dehydrogenase [Chromatiales bacterium]|nr:D-2-hydroxyacid dehydrogenase [Chromatiales bacterium]
MSIAGYLHQLPTKWWAWSISLSVALLAHSGVQARDTEALAEQARPVIERLGLRESRQPVREIAGWRRPSRIVVRSDADRVQWLQPAAPGVELVPASSAEEAVAAAAGSDGVIGFCAPELLTAGTGIRWLQLPYAGAENCLAIPAIRERDILVTNAQRIYGPEIAEHVMAMILSFTRGLHKYIPQQAQGNWDRGLVAEENLWELEGKTLLVVGLGGIGTEVARLGHGMGMRVIATRNSSRHGPEFVSHVGLADELPQLVPDADVVVNAAPLTPSTDDLFDADFFAAMKTTAYFINVGRGGSVVTDDLVSALRSGELAGAGLDVTDPEPLPHGHPLWKLPNVIITPHVAAGSDLRSERLWIVMRENLRRYAAGEPMLSVVDTLKGY